MDVTPVNAGSGVPPYQQVAIDLRRRIDAGELTGRLPRELDLAADYRVAHGTARKALALLREWGYVVTSAGYGSRVVPPGERGS